MKRMMAAVSLVICALSAAVAAQNVVVESVQIQAEISGFPKQSDLMAHSEMQVPKAIPTVKQLRFQEIPVDAQGLDPRNTSVVIELPPVMEEVRKSQRQPQEESHITQTPEKR